MFTISCPLQVEGRVANVASSPTGSRVLQTCARHGTPEQRKKLLQQVMPQLLELSKSAYAHFLVCKLIAMAPKSDIPGRPLWLPHPEHATSLVIFWRDSF